jgi:hypothetical protein
MSDSPPPARPTWLDPEALRAMEAARDRALREGRSPAAALAGAQAALRALHPGIPAAVAEAALAALGEGGEGLSGEGMRPAGPEELAEILAYALRYDDRGRPRRGGFELAAALAAERIAEHLRRSNLVVLRRPPAAPHGTG